MDYWECVTFRSLPPSAPRRRFGTRGGRRPLGQPAARGSRRRRDHADLECLDPGPGGRPEPRQRDRARRSSPFRRPGRPMAPARRRSPASRRTARASPSSLPETPRSPTRRTAPGAVGPTTVAYRSRQHGLDVSILKIDLEVPAAANCLSIDFRFLSDEYPESSASSFNDAFIAELDNSTWTTKRLHHHRARQLRLRPRGNVITSTRPARPHDRRVAAGTTYDGALRC